MGNKTLAAQVSMVIVTLMWAAGYITAKMAAGDQDPLLYGDTNHRHRFNGSAAGSGYRAGA